MKTTEPLHIAFVNHLALGTASFYRQIGLAKELVKRGHQVKMIMRSSNGSRKVLDLRSGSATTPCDERFLIERKAAFWAEPFEWRILQNIPNFRSTTSDVSIIHLNRANPYTSAICLCSTLLTPKRIVVDLEDWDGVGGYATLAKKGLLSSLSMTIFEKVMAHKGDAILVVSELLRRRMIFEGVSADKVFHVSNGVDEDVFKPEITGSRVREMFRLGTSPIIIFISTLWSFERSIQSKVLQVLRHVINEEPSARLLVVGGGRLESLVVEARKMGLVKNIVFAGYVPRSMLPQYIAAADVALHILDQHLFFRASCPMVIPEYMAMRKAIVAPDIGELHHMLVEGAGVLVPSTSSEELAEAVLRLLSDLDLRGKLGESALMKMRHRYSYRVLAEKVERAYTKALE